MITEQYKDTVYFSNLFVRHYPKVYEELSNILSRHHIAHGTLMHTKDYCAEIICQYSGELILIFNFAMNLII